MENKVHSVRKKRRVHRGRACGCLILAVIFILIINGISGCVKKLEKSKKAPPRKPDTVTEVTNAKPKKNISSDILIVVDPGHGGYDNGSLLGEDPKTNTALRYEKNDNLKYAKIVCDELNTRKGIKALMTREDDDTYLDNEERAKYSNDRGAALHLALHRNYSDDPDADGVELWIQKESKIPEQVLAFDIEQKFKEVNEGIEKSGKSSGGFRIRPTQQGYTSDKQNNFEIISFTDMTACIVELGFISNDKDNRIFDLYYKEYAKAIADAVEQWCKDDGGKYPKMGMGQYDKEPEVSEVPENITTEDTSVSEEISKKGKKKKNS